MFQVPAILRLMKMRSDNTVSFQVECNELAPEEMAKLFSLSNKIGFFLFKENKIQVEDLPQEEAKSEGKTPQERLRNVLYVYYKKRFDEGKIKKPFNEFYNEWINNKIETIKMNLDI